MKPQRFLNPAIRTASVALVLALAATEPASGATPDAPFTRLTSGPWSELAASVSVAAFDFDNNGWMDLFVGRSDSKGSLYRNVNGVFSKVADTPLAGNFGYVHGAAAVDYDNDGWTDLILASLVDDPKPSTILFHGKGNGAFERITNGPIATATGRAVAVAWADYTGDGLLDLFVGRGALVRNVADSLFINQGAAGFSQDPGVEFPPRRTDQGTWADFDGDGDLDLLVVHASQQGNVLYRNDGKGHFEVVNDSGLNQFGESVGAAWGDFDNDGDLDLIITNFSFNGPQSNFLYRNHGNGTFTRITDSPIATDSAYFMSASWVDYDNDGWLDLFVTVDPLGDPRGLKNRLYHNLGDGRFERITGGALVTNHARFAGASWLDYDNDGFPDVFVACGNIYEATPSFFYRNHGNSNHWLKVRCVGTLSNRSAIGTKVRVRATVGGVERWQLREIVGTEGWLSFNSLDQIIGLGDATVVSTMRIEWPSGIVQEFHNVPANQTLVLVEQTTLTVSRDAVGSVELKLGGPIQQRYGLDGSPDLIHWSPITQLTITNSDRTATYRPPASTEPASFFRARPE